MLIFILRAITALKCFYEFCLYEERQNGNYAILLLENQSKYRKTQADAIVNSGG